MNARQSVPTSAASSPGTPPKRPGTVPATAHASTDLARCSTAPRTRTYAGLRTSDTPGGGDRPWPRSRYSWDEPPADPIEAMMSIQELQPTGPAAVDLGCSCRQSGG